MKTLENLIAETLARPVPPEIAAMAEHVRQLHSGVEAVIAYGSCLRGVATTESLIDLYVLTAGLAGVSGNPLSRIACAIVPPNVYYTELEFEGQRYRAKYAVLPQHALRQMDDRQQSLFLGPVFTALGADLRHQSTSHECRNRHRHAHHVCQCAGSDEE